MKKNIAILIIHGFAGGTYDQEKLANNLQLIDNFDVFTFTLPGHDKYVLKGITKDDWIKSSEENLEKLIKHGYNIIYLIGHSMGGVLCTHLVNKYSEVKKVVLAAPAFEYMSSQDGKMSIIKSIKKTPKIIKRFDGIFDLLSRIVKVPISVVKEFQKLITSYQKEPKSINIPILIIHGLIDDIVPYQSSIKVFNEIPYNNKKLILVKNLNHNVFKGIKQDELIKIVIKFLNNNQNFNSETVYM